MLSFLTNLYTNIYLLMKRLLFLFFSSFVSSLVWAGDYQLVIDFIDGGEATFSLSKLPVLTFTDQRLCVSMGDQKSEFELLDVENYHFTADSSGTTSLRKDDDFSIIWRGENLIVKANEADEISILLYGIDGISYSDCVHDNGSYYEISLSALPKGIYLIRINNQRTLKINRK